MRTLYLITSGSADATRASVPLHLAVNGSLDVGHTVGLVLAGDATELLQADVRERLEGVGVPPIRDLFAKARQHDVPVYVWKGCAIARGATDEDLGMLGGQWVGPPDVARLIEEADRFVSIWEPWARAASFETMPLLTVDDTMNVDLAPGGFFAPEALASMAGWGSGATRRSAPPCHICEPLNDTERFPVPSEGAECER